jgi:hypothetical protein
MVFIVVDVLVTDVYIDDVRQDGFHRRVYLIPAAWVFPSPGIND